MEAVSSDRIGTYGAEFEDTAEDLFKSGGFERIYEDGTPSWWSEIVDRMSIPSFDESFKASFDLKANIHPAIVLEESGDFTQAGIFTRVVQVEVVRKLYLMCTGGRNRSQGLWNRATKCIPGEYIEKPHGAVKANDNFFSTRNSPLIERKVPPLRDLVGGQIITSTRQERFGVPGNTKLFDEEYWGAIISNGGTVVVAGKAFHAALHRLNELAGRKSKDLSKVHIYCISTDDPYGEKDVEARERKVGMYLRALEKVTFSIKES